MAGIRGRRRIASWIATGALAACAAAGVGVAGCGSDARYDAESFAAELSEAGTPLELGEPLQSDTEGVEIHAVTLEEGSEKGEEAHPGDEHGATEDHEHGAGAVSITPSEEAGRAEFLRCETAVSLICFRAANAVLRFSSLTPEEQAGLSESLMRLAVEP